MVFTYVLWQYSLFPIVHNYQFLLIDKVTGMKYSADFDFGTIGDFFSSLISIEIEEISEPWSKELCDDYEMRLSEIESSCVNIPTTESSTDVSVNIVSEIDEVSRPLKTARVEYNQPAISNEEDILHDQHANQSMSESYVETVEYGISSTQQNMMENDVRDHEDEEEADYMYDNDDFDDAMDSDFQYESD